MNMESNCLSYALRYWNLYPEYRLYYNSDHVVNLPVNACIGFLPIEYFGYDYFLNWYKNGLINEEDLVLLSRYFSK